MTICGTAVCAVTSDETSGRKIGPSSGRGSDAAPRRPSGLGEGENCEGSQTHRSGEARALRRPRVGDRLAAAVAPEGAIRFPGLGSGTLPFQVDTDAVALPWGVNVQRSFGGTRADQLQVIALAQQGKVTVEAVKYPLADLQQAFDDLEANKITGRGLLVP